MKHSFLAGLKPFPTEEQFVAKFGALPKSRRSKQSDEEDSKTEQTETFEQSLVIEHENVKQLDRDSTIKFAQDMKKIRG